MTDQPTTPQSPPQHKASVPNSAQHKPSSGSLKKVSLIVLVVFGLVAVAGIVSRAEEARSLRKNTDKNAIASVATITAEAGAQNQEVVLPGTVQAWHEATIYARTSGYLKTWKADIGAHVKEGELLAEIDAPDLDAQYHQAQADLGTAEANNRLAQITAKRWVELLKSDSVSKQDVDTKVANADAAAATVASQKANLDHLQQQEDFKKVIAPFDGTITQRNTDMGALVVGDSSSGTGQDLFHIAQTDRLRVYVRVPENDAGVITPDMSAELHFPQLPQQSFTAKLSQNAEALDPVTRTLLVELAVDNADGALMSGGYADAHLKIPQSGNIIILPVNALLFRDVERVGIVKDDKVTLQPVKIGRDYGKTVEILTGISAGDQIVINPPDSLQDGQQVTAVSQDKKDADAKKNAPPKKDEKDESSDEKKPSVDTTGAASQTPAAVEQVQQPPAADPNQDNQANKAGETEQKPLPPAPETPAK